ncbi:hypothetical protein D3C84_367780 [compost metagenome]
MALLDIRLEVILEPLGIQRLVVAQHQQGEWPLAPLRIRHPDHRHFTHGRMTADQVFQGQ